MILGSFPFVETSLREYLNKLVEEGGCMEIHEAMFYWSQIMDALKFLHHLRVPVAHKDIKAENVLLSVKDNLVQVKLADYDTVKKLNNLFTKPGLKAKGTHGLVSPEVLYIVAFICLYKYLIYTKTEA